MINNSEQNLIGINISHKYSGIGKYANDINELINVYSFIIDKNKKDKEYIGKKYYCYYPKFSSGWAINNSLIPIYTKLKNIEYKFVHLLMPMNNTGLKGIITIHDLYFMHRKLFNESYLHILLRKFHKWKIIVPSEMTKDDLIKYFNYNENEITVIPMSVKQSVFHNSKILENIKTIDILTVGDGKFKHNWDISFLAYKNNLNHLHIGYDNVVPASSTINDIDDNDLNYYYNLSKVAVRYSDIEGFGIPAIQSIFAGTPIILKRIKVFEEIMGKEYPLFVDKLNEIPIKIKEAEDFKINEYFKNEWFIKYSFNTFRSKMYDIYREYL